MTYMIQRFQSSSSRQFNLPLLRFQKLFRKRVCCITLLSFRSINGLFLDCVQRNILLEAEWQVGLASPANFSSVLTVEVAPGLTFARNARPYPTSCPVASAVSRPDLRSYPPVVTIVRGAHSLYMKSLCYHGTSQRETDPWSLMYV